MGLSPGTEYHYRVRADNTAGSSAYSNVASDTTVDAISILSAVLYKVKGVHHVDLTWRISQWGQAQYDANMFAAKLIPSDLSIV